MYIVVGLGNPGKQYENNRHNAGKLAVGFLKKENVSVKFIDTDTYMNMSGKSVSKIVSSIEEAKRLVVIYDDIDLPIGSLKISYNRGSGGHNGVESIEKALKTREFIRFRIGVAPVNIFGKIKKPRGDRKVHNFLLGDFKKSEMDKLQNVFRQIVEAFEVLEKDGLNRVMTEFN